MRLYLALLLGVAGVFAGSPALAKHGGSHITNAFDDSQLSAARAYCAQRYSPNDVVRRDNNLTSQLYGKQGYNTYYVKLNSKYLTDRNYGFSGSLYCMAEAVLSGWKEHKDDGSFASLDTAVTDLMQKSPPTTGAYADWVAYCKPDVAVWSLEQLSHDVANISHQGTVWFYAKQNGLKWQEQSGKGSSYANHFACLKSIQSPSEDYAVYDAAIRANIAARDKAAADKLAAEKAAQQHAAAGNLPPGVTKIATVHRLTNGDGLLLFTPTEAWVLPKSAPAYSIDQNGVVTATFTGNGQTALFKINGVISPSGSNILTNAGANVISNDGNSLVAAGAGNLVASGAGNLVASGAGNFTSLSGLGGSSLLKTFSLISQDGGSLQASISNFISHNGSALVGNSGGTLIQLATSSIVPRLDTSLYGANSVNFSAGGYGLADTNGNPTVYADKAKVPSTCTASPSQARGGKGSSIVLALKGKKYATVSASPSEVLGFACLADLKGWASSGK
ncbi:MAG: hypothetical protein GIW95_11320 [Candidatus Eremiobacteraeota bacterium]|nr:hypothetical protein [Candidatus Eremiobacteraeota bacterium]